MRETITTIGAALDWLIAHPSEMLVDSDGDLWRIHLTEFLVQVGDEWEVPSVQRTGLTWRPAPKRVE